MANENGVNVQEKANDVELIELSDDGMEFYLNNFGMNFLYFVIFCLNFFSNFRTS